MAHNLNSDDIEHVIQTPSPPTPPERTPQEPWPLPDYEPMHTKQLFRTGVHKLPSNVSISDAFVIFSLFFDHSILKTLAKHTNKYAALYPSDPIKFPDYSAWKPTTWKELRAYRAAYIWMGLYKKQNT